MPNVPEIVKRRNIVLHPWCMPYALARRDKKDQNSSWDYVCYILFSERRRLSHLKANDAMTGVHKRKYRFTLHRWHADEEYQESHWNHGWTEEYCGYLDIPKSKRGRQIPLDEKLRSELEWPSWNCWKIHGSQASSSSATTWWQPQQ